MLYRLHYYLILLVLFLLPGQTRWIYATARLNGHFWEYGTMSLYGVEILLWLIVFVWGFRQWHERKYVKSASIHHFPRGYLYLAVGFFLWVFFVISQSQNIDYSIYIFSHWILSVCFALVLWSYVDQRISMLGALWSGGVLQGIVAMVQFFTQTVWANKWLGMASQNPSDLGVAVVEFTDARWLRAYGSFGWPNSLGVYLAIIWVVGLIIFNNLKKISALQKIIISTGQLVILFGLLLTFSRNAIVGAVLGTIVFLLVNLKKRGEPRRYLPLIFFGGILGIILTVVYLPFFNLRLQATGRLEAISLSDRQIQLLEWGKVMNGNWLVGVGPGNYTRVLYKLDSSKSVWQYQPVHRVYNLIMAEWGVLVALFLFFWLVVWFGGLMRRYSDFLALAVVLIFTGWFDHGTISMFTGIVLWGVMVGVSLPKIIFPD